MLQSTIALPVVLVVTMLLTVWRWSTIYVISVLVLQMPSPLGVQRRSIVVTGAGVDAYAMTHASRYLIVTRGI